MLPLGSSTLGKSLHVDLKLPGSEPLTVSKRGSANPYYCDYCAIEPDGIEYVDQDEFISATAAATKTRDTYNGRSFRGPGVYFTAYVTISGFSAETGCTTAAETISLIDPFFVPSASYITQGVTITYYAESIFRSFLNHTTCFISTVSLVATTLDRPLITPLPSLSAVVPQPTATTTNLSPSRPTLNQAASWKATTKNLLPSRRILDPAASVEAALTNLSPPRQISNWVASVEATTTNLSPSQHIPNSTASMKETRKLVIGLVIAITAVVMLVSLGIAHLYIVRRRQRRKHEATRAHQDVKVTDDEAQRPQMYLQRKAELDDAQRRHEMEALELRRELHGDEIHEMAGGEEGGGSHWGSRQELRGREIPAEIG